MRKETTGELHNSNIMYYIEIESRKGLWKVKKIAFAQSEKL